jgi:hypothetical protein
MDKNPKSLMHIIQRGRFPSAFILFLPKGAMSRDAIPFSLSEYLPL